MKKQNKNVLNAVCVSCPNCTSSWKGQLFHTPSSLVSHICWIVIGRRGGDALQANWRPVKVTTTGSAEMAAQQGVNKNISTASAHSLQRAGNTQDVTHSEDLEEQHNRWQDRRLDVDWFVSAWLPLATEWFHLM